MQQVKRSGNTVLSIILSLKSIEDLISNGVEAILYSLQLVILPDKVFRLLLCLLTIGIESATTLLHVSACLKEKAFKLIFRSG